ncbi:alpha/beta hydrolase fold domain-containing protein [bacterium]|nr:alpha/beta hydrolase fold domain-containing protein [bacterium]
MIRHLTLCLAILTCLTATTYAQRNYPPELPGSQSYIYKTVGDVKLPLYVYSPKDHQATDHTPCIVFFFGGGWANGSPQQFEQQCQYLASRGMVAITADYRVASRHGVKAVDCVKDAKSAIRWVREHASELGIDPDKVVASGGSAGGHLAACAGVITEFDEPTESANISSRPNAMVLFNPAVSFTPPTDPVRKKQAEGLANRTGVPPEQISPAHHVVKDLPPTLILIGSDDFLIEGNREFIAKMEAAGNRCELDLYDGRSHGFFNYGRGNNADFKATTASMDRFLTSLGYLQGKPTVDQFFSSR